MDAEDCSAGLADILPPLDERQLILYDLIVTGRAGPVDRVTLEKETAKVAPDFLWHRADFGQLGLDHDTSDLDMID
jgi:hypothetical protein